MAIKIIFQSDRCKGCELCVSVCPKHILAIDTANINIKGYHPAHCEDPSQCVGCASCARMCPDSIISIYRDDDAEPANERSAV